MNCEQANNFISARVDGEMAGDDRAALDAHLAQCETCRRTLAEVELGDAVLLRAFSQRREDAAALADRVRQTISQESVTARPVHIGSIAPRLPRSALVLQGGFAAAAAAGFILGIVLMKSGGLRRNESHAVARASPLQPVAHLTLATGAVFTCPSDQQSWRTILPHDAIEVGSAIRTGETSKCELQLADGSCVRLNAATEARFTSDRDLRVSVGQLWSALPRNAAQLRVSTGQTRVTACGVGDDRGTEFDLACAGDFATVTVRHGAADVGGNVAKTTVHSGQMLHAPSPASPFACTAMPDPLLAAQWQDDLLVLKPADDPEVVARVDELMERIATDGAAADQPCPLERDLRAGGQAWCPPMACYIRNPSKSARPANRRVAARLLADLAPTSSIPDLIDLLADEDGEIRSCAAAALRRLTGRTLGYPPEQCADRRDPAARAAWRKWWEQGLKN